MVGLEQILLELLEERHFGQCFCVMCLTGLQGGTLGSTPAFKAARLETLHSAWLFTSFQVYWDGKAPSSHGTQAQACVSLLPSR